LYINLYFYIKVLYVNIFKNQLVKFGVWKCCYAWNLVLFWYIL